MSSFSRRIFALVSLCCAVGVLFAQSENIRPNGNSPYSRFGLGDPVNQFFAAQGGMAGLTAAFNDPYHLNVQNPASLAYLQATAFEVGVFGKYANLQDGDTNSDIWSGNLNYMALGFPLINPISSVLDKRDSPWNFGMNIALRPFTSVAYDIRAQVDNGENLGMTTNTFKGEGGTYQLTLGNGIKYNNLSFGVNIGYLFGKISRDRNVAFDSLELAYTTDFLDEFSVRGFTWNVGVQYEIELNEDRESTEARRRLILGAYGNSATNFTTEVSRLYQRDIFYAQTDTLVYDIGEKGSGRLPAQWSVGVTYEQLNKFKIGAEYSLAQWSQYENDAQPDNLVSLVDANRFAVGLEYIPEFNSYDSYFKKVRYRTGFQYATDPRQINSDQLQTYSVSIGLGFPIIRPRQQVSFINLSVEAGEFGMSDAVMEQFVRATVGFTLNDNSWFFKRKFN